MGLRVTKPIESDYDTGWREGYEAASGIASTNFDIERERLETTNETLRDLLAECYPLVRRSTDLSRRMREALGRSRDG